MSLLPVFILTVIMGFVLFKGIGDDDLVGGDEGYYGVMARNILEDPSYIVNTSLSPLGEPGDKPFLYPLILSAAMRLGGIDEAPLRTVSLVASLLTGIIIYLAVASMLDSRTAAIAACMYLVTPLIANTGRQVAAEPSLLAFAMAGVVLFLRGEKRLGGKWTFLLSGMMFGAAFLCKLWLALVPAFGVVTGTVLFRLRGRFTEKRRKAFSSDLLPFVFGFMLASSVQLILCTILTPHTLGHWLKVYFGFSLAERASGAGFASYWLKPWHFYLVTVFRSLALWLPLVCAGIPALYLSRKESPGFYIFISWLFPLLVMSFMPVKTGGYILPFIPALFLAAAAGWRYMMSTERSPGRYPLMAAAVAAAILSFLSRTGEPGWGTISQWMSPIIAIQSAWIMIMLISAALRGTSERLSVWLSAMLIITILAGIYRDRQITDTRGHATGYSRLSEHVLPYLSDVDPRVPCFISPEWPAVSFYTFRTGLYWDSPYTKLEEGFLKRSFESDAPFFYIMGGPKSGLYGDIPSDSLRTFVRRNTYELDSSGEVGGYGLELRTNRVFGR